ncbi:hypothetical protein Rhopal_001274-T1 [Rhodotorula paludigena]|uniref:GH16 domain-containing protein n=1 Tax=Rhodotorula paludigena TaxID=86838 RepID=A0AAV5GGB9_9BASI|nr:hypothetical protein Rhopal_001274-T1 [Rhodotorula paludigena]
MPVCSSSNYTFSDDSRIQRNHSAWNGDASAYDFTLDVLDSSNPPLVANNELVLTLTENGGGTRVSTTRNVLYGTIQANMRTVATAGVVTAFITMSGVKDEIDYEWTGGNTDEVQSNWYWEGDIADYSHGGKHTANNRDTSYITYGLVWTPTELDWQVNGRTVRTLKKSDDPNGRFPQTPSRVQFSVWPAGVAGTSQGTIDWAGGMIDWSSSEYKRNNNAFTAGVRWLSIDCYDGNDALPFVQSNQTSSSSNDRRRVRRGVEARSEEDDALRLWARQSQSVNSWVWGANDTNGQIGISGSDASTVINSPFSTGQNMLVKNGDTKGVSNGRTSGTGSTGIFGDTAAGHWWARQSTAAKAGIGIAIGAVVLFVIVAACTLWARRKDRGKEKRRVAAAAAAAGGAAGGKAGILRRSAGKGGNEAIPLVSTPGGGGASSSSTRDLPGRFANAPPPGSRPAYGRGGGDSYATLHDNGSVYSTGTGGDASSLHKGSFRSASPYGGGGAPQPHHDPFADPYGAHRGTPPPPVPSIPPRYAAAASPPAYPPAQGPYGAYPPQSPGYGGYGGQSGQGQGQGWGRY